MAVFAGVSGGEVCITVASELLSSFIDHEDDAFIYHVVAELKALPVLAVVAGGPSFEPLSWAELQHGVDVFSVWGH